MFKSKKSKIMSTNKPENERKENNVNEATAENIFPSAEDMLSSTSKNWPITSSTEILKKIRQESVRGWRKAEFYMQYISAEDREALEKQGYHVFVREMTDIFNTPYFEVCW